MRRMQRLAALAIAACAATSALAQETPPDLRDLVGARGAGGETALTSRGFVNVGGRTGDDRKWTYWWNARRGLCLSVATVNGRYEAITVSPASDCRPRPVTLPGPVGPPIPNRPPPATTLPGPVGPPVANGRSEDIRFERGASTARRNGNIRGYETVTYRLEARAGQPMTVALQSSNRSGYFNITSPGAREALFNGAIGGARYQGRAPASGVYRVEVYLMRNAARRGESMRYTLDVALRR